MGNACATMILGFEFIISACRGMDLLDGGKASKEILQRGVNILHSTATNRVLRT